MFPDVSAVVCRYDAMMNGICELQLTAVVPAVADCSSVENLSHTKQCIIHADLSSDVTSVCGVLLPRIQTTGAKVYKCVAVSGTVGLCSSVSSLDSTATCRQLENVALSPLLESSFSI